MDITHFNVAQNVGVHEILYVAGLDHFFGTLFMDSSRIRVYTMQVIYMCILVLMLIKY